MWEPTRQATGKKWRGSPGLHRAGVWWKDEKVSLTEGTEDGLSEEEADSWQEVTTLNHFISTSHYTPNLPPTPPFSIAFAAFFSPPLPAALFSPLFTSSSPLRLAGPRLRGKVESSGCVQSIMFGPWQRAWNTGFRCSWQCSFECLKQAGLLLKLG